MLFLPSSSEDGYRILWSAWISQGGARDTYWEYHQDWRKLQLYSPHDRLGSSTQVIQSWYPKSDDALIGAIKECEDRLSAIQDVIEKLRIKTQLGILSVVRNKKFFAKQILTLHSQSTFTNPGSLGVWPYATVE